jgi:hypothetical protein
MQVYSDRFETVLPKEERFNFPPVKPPTQQKPAFPAFLGYLLTGILIGVVVMAIPKPQPQPQSPPAPVAAPAATPAVVAPTPPSLPDPVPPRTLPVPTQGSVPRAQLLHIRAIGTFENDRMPDGRTLGTTYRGELPNPGALPRRGAQLGDMWYTRNDGHTWVLAPIAGGSQTVGWIDP